MKFSFLVTFYNQKEYVGQCLDSILAIEKPDEWEILVGDDGSTDGTEQAIRYYIEKYPKNIFLYVMPRDLDIKYDSVKRASANRLNILKHATGDFFCILDGDDFYIDTSFAGEALKIFDSYSSVSVVSYGYKYYSDGKYSNGFKLPLNKEGIVETEEYIRNYYLHAGACVYKFCFPKERIDYIESVGYFDDNDIVMNSLNYGKMYHVQKSVYAYRQTGQSIYTSMKTIEQAVLNVLGMDVDLCLIDKSYRNDILYRNACSVIEMYIFRKELKNIISEDKINFYLQGVSEFEHSYCRSIINDDVGGSMFRDILLMMLKNPKCTIKNYYRKFWKSR